MFAPAEPTPHLKTYANLNTAVVAATDDPKRKGRHAIGFYVGGAGTVVVRPRGGTVDDDQTITCSAGANFTCENGIEFDQIVSGTATNVTVFWGR
jgi:hypothetical protein